MSNIDERSADPEDLFDETYYATYLGGVYGRTEPWLNFFGGLAGRIKSDLEPTTVLELGCAWGFLVEGLRDRGVDATGHDISSYAISQVAGTADGHCHVRSATDPIEQRYELIISIEMIEHMSAAEGRKVIEQMTEATDQILLSTTPFHHEEATHFNVQPPEYWARIMAEHGFYRNVDYDASYLTNWAGLFVRKDPRPRDLAFAYERSEWLHRNEALTLRKEVTRLEVELNRLRSDEEARQRSSSAEKRVVEAEEQLRTARDSAIGAEAQLGQIEGQIIELQERLWLAQGEQVELTEADVEDNFRVGREAVEQLEAVRSSTSWRLIWGLLAPYRRLRGRS